MAVLAPVETERLTNNTESEGAPIAVETPDGLHAGVAAAVSTELRSLGYPRTPEQVLSYGEGNDVLSRMAEPSIGAKIADDSKYLGHDIGRAVEVLLRGEHHIDVVRPGSQTGHRLTLGKFLKKVKSTGVGEKVINLLSRLKRK